MPEKRDAVVRETAISVRLSDDEALRLDTASRGIGVTRSTYVRIALMEKLRREQQPTPHKPKPKHAS